MARKRKRTRRKLNWAPILWLLCIANIGLGLKYSSLFIPLLIRVEGVPVDDQQRVRQALQPLGTAPAWNSPTLVVEEEVLRRPDVASASIQLNLLRRGLVKVRYEQPIGYFSTVPSLGLSAEGHVIPVREQDHLLRVRLYPQALIPLATFSSGFECRLLSEVCRRVLDAKLGNPEVELAENGSLQLNFDTKARVVLGSPSDLDLKFQRLVQAASDPTMLQAGNELNLMAPDKPSLKKVNNSE